MDRDLQAKLNNLENKNCVLQAQIFALSDRLQRIENELGLNKQPWFSTFLTKFLPDIRLRN